MFHPFIYLEVGTKKFFTSPYARSLSILFVHKGVLTPCFTSLFYIKSAVTIPWLLNYIVMASYRGESIVSIITS